MTAHDDRARDERQAADELTAHDQEQGHYDERPGINVMGDVDPADIRHGEQPAPTPRETTATYTCRVCDRSAPWTDGQSVAAGDPADEYWCQTCGEEQPLPEPDERETAADEDRSTRLVRAIDEVEGNHDALIMVRCGDVVSLIAEIKELTPRPRETAADELAEALDTLANPTATPGMRIGAAGIAWNEAEMLRRDLSAARARTNAAFSAFEAAGYDLSENGGDLADLVRELAAERDAARAEVERLRARVTELEGVERVLARVVARTGRDREVAQLRGWYEQVRAENERLHRARDRRNDERLAGAAVVRVWSEVRDRPNARWPVPIVGALDALARAHEDGGRDR